MNMYLTVGKKIALICSLLLVALIVEAWISMHAFGNIRKNVGVMTNQSVPGVVNAGDVSADIYLLRGNCMKHIIAQTLQEMDQIQQENDVVVQRLHASLQKMQSTAVSAEDRQDAARVSFLVDQYIAAWQTVQPLSRMNKTAEAVALYDKTTPPLISELKQLTSAMRSRHSDEQNLATKQVDSTLTESLSSVRILCTAAALAGTIAAFFIVGGINRKLRTTAFSLSSASREIASASEAVAQGSTEQAATIEETSSASTEINSMAQRNTESARTANDLVAASQARFEEANQSLTEMVEAMNGITSSSQKISKIIKVIDEIAFQTNILALNAAVEAARAGEAGMGFAVVADEVRSLAQRSAQAARDTATLIEESIERSQSGKEKVDMVAKGIRAVTSESAKIKMLVEEINLGSAEQSRGIDQIARSIGEMEQVTQSGAASAQQLSTNAQTMREVVQSLTIMVGSVDRRAPRGTAADRRPQPAGGQASSAGARLRPSSRTRSSEGSQTASAHS